MTEKSERHIIPKTYNELLEFINEHKAWICTDWESLLEIIKALDNLLKAAENMSDLRRDARVILETIKMQQDALIREFRHELSFEKALLLAEKDSLDAFFDNVKISTQKISFVDHLDFNYAAKDKVVRKERIAYDKSNGRMQVPDILDGATEVTETNVTLQSIKSQVLVNGKIEYFRLICDKESFSKTVLNAFNLALALRMKLVSFKSLASVLYVVPYESADTQLDHSVLEITPKQYEKIKAMLSEDSN